MNELIELEASMYRDGIFEFLDLNPKQKTAIKKLTDSKTDILAFGGGANGGKSWLGCVWLLYNALTYPETKWFIGREELKRLRESTLLTFNKVVKHYGIDRDLFNYNGQDHFIQFTNGSRIDLLDLKYLPSDPLFERYGSLEYTGGWIEEAGEVVFGAFDTLKTRIGRHMNDRHKLFGKLLITCNPKKNWLYRTFYKPWRAKKLPKGLAFIQSLIGDNQKRESGSLEKLKSITDKVRRERLLMGNWEYDDDPASLMDFQSIEAVFTNDHVAVDTGFRAVTADIARLGADKTVIIVWFGWVAMRIVELAKTTTDKTEEVIKGLARQYEIPKHRIVIDEDGLGGGVVDHIPGCLGFINNSRPIQTGAGQANYTNLKSQCYFNLADRVNTHGIYISCATEEQRELIRADLEQIKRKDPDKDGKQAVVGKDRMKEALGRSPDYGDSIMMREYLELVKPRSRALKNVLTRR